MNILNYFKRVFRSDTRSKNFPSDGAITVNMLGRDNNLTSPENALKIETFYNSVRDKAETIGGIPLKLQRNTDKGKELVESGRLHRIFTVQPNEYMTWQSFNEMIVASLETLGAFYAYPVYNSRGNVAEIIPFANQRGVSPAMDHDGRVYYTYVTNSGDIFVTPATKLMVISAFTLNGYTPISPIMKQANLLGLAKSQESNYQELQDNGIKFQMALRTNNVFKDVNAIARLKEDWNRSRGKDGYKTIPILENGLEPVKLNLTPAEMELISHREFTSNSIQSMTRVPAYRLQGNRNSTDHIFELDESYLRNSLNPTMMKIEAAINLIINKDYTVTFDRNAYYAGSPWRLAESIDKSIRGGFMSVADGIRAMGNVPPPETENIFAIQTNNAIYGEWSEYRTVRDQINNADKVNNNDEPDEKQN